MADTKAPAPANAPKRLSDYSSLPGEALEDIQDEEVVVAGIFITERRLKDNPSAPFAVITLGGERAGEQYHSWSPSLIEKLSAVPEEALPVPAKFVKVETANRREVWTVE